MLDLICSLDSTKATGEDVIFARILKATAVSIFKSLSDLFNKSIIMGSFLPIGNLLELSLFPSQVALKTQPFRDPFQFFQF